MDNGRAIIEVVKENLKPARGCTEPGAIGYAAARAAAVLENVEAVEPDAIRVWLSGSVYKNARSVGIPGTSSSGIALAVVLGALYGKADRALEVFGGITEAEIARAESYCRRTPPSVDVDNSEEPFFIAVEIDRSGHTGRCTITGDHTHVTYVGVDGRTVYQAEKSAVSGEMGSLSWASLSAVLNSRVHLDEGDEAFFMTAIEKNRDAGTAATQSGALELTAALFPRQEEPGVAIGELDSLIRRFTRTTVAAVEDRMTGASRSIITNSGSGNQGLTATIPVVLAAESLGSDKRTLIEAVYLSHAINVYVRSYQAVLSGMCGLIGAALGAVCGVLYLVTPPEGLLEAVRRASNAMTASVTGMICDGAKVSCAYKCALALDAAAYGYRLVQSGIDVFEGEGVVGEDLEQTIQNLGGIATRGLCGVDDVVLGRN